MDEENGNNSLAALADILVRAREEKAAAEEAKRIAEARIKAIEQLMYAKMAAEGIENERFTHNGHGFRPKVESFPSVNKEKEDELFDWLEARRIRLTIHPQSFRGWYNANADTYAEELSDKQLVNVYETIRIGVTKAA